MAMWCNHQIYGRKMGCRSYPYHLWIYNRLDFGYHLHDFEEEHLPYPTLLIRHDKQKKTQQTAGFLFIQELIHILL